MYGATRAHRLNGLSGVGLSPRVRGNRRHGAHPPKPDRSIPACTGQPGVGECNSYESRVYPRVYGATVANSLVCALTRGLSPRVRGNPSGHKPTLPVSRSIPACTGQPSPPDCCPRQTGVYPRVYGATAGQSTGWEKWNGLSPRVRGNPVGQRRQAAGVGSIPACTGQPFSHGANVVSGKVYPRVYGATQRRQA